MSNREKLLKIFKTWYYKYFSDPEAVTLLLTIIVLILLFWFFGRILAPILVSVVIAYILEGLVKRFKQWGMPHLIAVSLVCVLFVGIVIVMLLWLLPLIWQQLYNLINEIPNIIGRGQALLIDLPQRYPRFISLEHVNYVTSLVKSEGGAIGKVILSYFLAAIPNLIEIIVYAILVPILVFFLLKDDEKITHWLAHFLPKRRRTLRNVWQDVNFQFGNYIRARILEMIIVGLITGLTFWLFGLQYAVLLAAIVAVATIIPYIGAVVSTIPVVVIALVQWGLSAKFWYLIIAYTVISIVDSNIIVPLLFSETMDLHPVAIIVAVVFFGGLWGFWGVFFAIPLATVVKAIIIAWPKRRVRVR